MNCPISQIFAALLAVTLAHGQPAYGPGVTAPAAIAPIETPAPAPAPVAAQIPGGIQMRLAEATLPN